MKERKQKKYFRFDKAERASIEHALDKNDSARSLARGLGRSPVSITDEVKRNRTVAKGPGKDERVEEMPEDACVRLSSWPWTCNGCRLRRYHCTKKFKCEHSAARAQTLADELLSAARRGGPGPLARPDSGRARIRILGPPLDNLPLGGGRICWHVQRRVSAQSRLQT